MKIHWRRISITDNADRKDLEKAKKLAKRHTKGQLPSLPFTEANPEWILLYEHAQLGQITSKTMRYMKRNDLYYLAGMTFPHPGLIQPESAEERLNPWNAPAEDRWDRVTKLQGNATRAKIELERRNFVWASIFTILAALAGGFIGALLGK